MKQSNGFSLIELIVVISIIGILMAVATPSMIKRIENARELAVKENTETLCNAVYDIMLRHEFYEKQWGEVYTYSLAMELDALIAGGASACQVAGYSMNLTGLEDCYLSRVVFKGVTPDTIYTPID